MNIREEIAEEYDEVCFAEGFDKACMGIAHRACNPSAVAYDYDKCVDILMQDDMPLEDAIEHMEFNVLGSYIGDRTPIFIQRFGDGSLNIYGVRQE